MDYENTAAARARNDELQVQIDDMLENLAQRNTSMAGAQRAVGDLRASGQSADKLVRVEVDAGGAVTGAKVAPSALRGNVETLNRSIVEAANRAAKNARREAARLMRDALGSAEWPDLPDLVPGAPSLHSFDSDSILNRPDSDEANRPRPRDEDPDWNTSILRDPLR